MERSRCGSRRGGGARDLNPEGPISMLAFSSLELLLRNEYLIAENRILRSNRFEDLAARQAVIENPSGGRPVQ
jgi:hypothetical protein